MDVGSAITPCLGRPGGCNPLLWRQGKAVETSLFSNPVEFDGVKFGVD